MNRLLPALAVLMLTLSCGVGRTDPSANTVSSHDSNRMVVTSTTSPDNSSREVTPSVQTAGGANRSPISPDPHLTPGDALDVTREECSTPFGIIGIFTRVSTDVFNQVMAVLNAFRHHWNLHLGGL